MNEIGVVDGEPVAAVRKWKQQYFGHTIRAHNLCTYTLEGRLVDADIAAGAGYGVDVAFCARGRKRSGRRQGAI